ncbi:MAG: chemotaxis protein CheC, partial [Angelakisella sp.]
MALKNYDDLNDIQMDALREIGNIGSGNAATSLASMLSKQVNIEVPTVRIVDHAEVSEMLGGPENVLVGMLLCLSGDITGMMMFLLEKDFAHLVLNTLLGQDLTSFDEVDEMGLSALQEISNIMAASYVNSISQLTGMVIDISVPSICIDMVGSMLSVPMIY